MKLLENIIIDNLMQERMDSDALLVSDHLLLGLANFAAEIFPLSTVYIGAQQQAVDTPALFIDFYSLSSQKRMAMSDTHELGIEITYVPVDHLSHTELSGAMFLIQRDLRSIHTGLGMFYCYATQGDITDGLAHITGLVRIMEVSVSGDPIIQTAEKELIT